MMFYIQKVKCKLHYDNIVFCKTLPWSLFNTINQEQDDCDHISHLVGYLIGATDHGFPP